MRKWMRSSFRNRIFIMLLIVTLLPLLLCDVLLMQLQVQRSETTLETEAVQQLSDLEQALSDLSGDLTQVARRLTGSTVVRSALRRGGGDSRTLYQVLFRYTEALRGYASFDICDSTGRCYYTTGSALAGNVRDPGWGVLYAAAQSKGLVFRAGEGCMEAAQAVRGYDGTILGYLVVSVSEENFARLFDGPYTSLGSVLLLDEYWQTIYASQSVQAAQTTGALRAQLLAGAPLTGADESCHYFTAVWEQTGFTLVLQQPRAFTAEALRSFYTICALMGGLCLLLGLLCAWLLSRHLSQPVRQLDEAMEAVRGGNYAVHLSTNREDEFGRLTNSFNRMTHEYGANLNRSVQRQRELNAARIRMMQAQLNPHFLYNTLDSIKWLSVTHHVPQIADLATDLAKILRTSVSEAEFVTLEQELDLVDRYVDIQLIRFEDRFTCEIDVEERFQHCLLPKLALQPLVENAIIHGVAGREEGYIKIWAEQDADDLRLYVSDNGCGIPPETLAWLNSPEKKPPEGHLGLYNVDQIARLYYGAGYGISAQPEPGGGSRVCLRIQMRRKETLC